MPKKQGYEKPKLLSYYIKQDEWKPTIPRGPVAAMYNSPGPAIVMLRPLVGETSLTGVKHDYTRTKAPSYFMGQKCLMREVEFGPGPAAYNICGWTNKGFDRCPAPLMGIRLDPIKIGRTPGPADYSREKSDYAVYYKPPRYTMAARWRNPATGSVSPGPNAYTLPPVLGMGNTPYPNRAPGYSMGLKLEGARVGETPGPANYTLPSTDVYKEKLPSYTVPKAEDKKTWVQTPGPLDYYNENVNINKYSAPKCTFGIKHSPYKGFPTFAAEK